MSLIDTFAFIIMPIILIGLLIIFLKKLSKTIKTIIFTLLVIIVGLGIYMHNVEPYWYKVTEYNFETNKISNTIKIVFLADIQTDHFGSYEESIFKTVNDLQPDIVLLGGDYIHAAAPANRTTEIAKFKKLLSTLNPKLGVFAVIGNLDDEKSMHEYFQDTSVIYNYGKHNLTDNIDLFLLSETEFWDTELNISTHKEKYNIILGHAPDYALGSTSAALMLAGHTHGGQIQIPFYGPILTFSKTPREWGSGLTDIGNGRTLIVSNGIGMERGSAPPVRLFCRPEIIVINLTSI